MHKLSDEEVAHTAALSQELLNVLMEHDAKTCQGAIITIAAICCMIEADGNRLQALGLADKLCADVKGVLQKSIVVQEEPDEDDTGVRN